MTAFLLKTGIDFYLSAPLTRRYGAVVVLLL